MQTQSKSQYQSFKLLNALIVKEGEISKKNDTPKAHKSRLRLLAGMCFHSFQKISTFQIEPLSCTCPTAILCKD